MLLAMFGRRTKFKLQSSGLVRTQHIHASITTNRKIGKNEQKEEKKKNKL